MPKKKTQTNVVDKAIEKLQSPGIDVDSINKALTGKNYSELVEFMLRFSISKDCQKVLQVLARMQDNPQFLCGDNEFQTVRTAAAIDGQRELIRAFVNLMSMGIDQDREALENILNRNHLI